MTLKCKTYKAHESRYLRRNIGQGGEVPRKQNILFFLPLWPTLIRTQAPVFGNKQTTQEDVPGGMTTTGDIKKKKEEKENMVNNKKEEVE